jgi:gamma-glutamyltranspeptidase/glutathione hydrolase
MARNGMVSSPHYLATLAGLRVLQEGGNAVDAAIAVNSTLGVVYPHMTGMGGDAFWLIYDAAKDERHALNGSGRAIGAATIDFYTALGHSEIPMRGALSAVTVPGAVDSWCMAHERFGKLSLADDLSQAIAYARNGYPVSPGQMRFTEATLDVLARHSDSARNFLPEGCAPRPGQLLALPNLAHTMEQVARKGRAGFYEGEVAAEIVRALRAEGALWETSDLSAHHGDWCAPISTTYRGYECIQHPPNSQGFVHLMMLNILERFDIASMHPDSAAYIHLIVEATKLAFISRDRYLSDPELCPVPLSDLLSKEYAAELAAQIRLDEARDIPSVKMGSDTTCSVVVDGDGNAVSIIQSLYHEFGSGVVAGETGLLIQNRGSFFSLDPAHVNSLRPNKRCFHTLMPGMAFRDGKLELVYGTMGGEGQPQTSTVVASRVIDFGDDVQTAIDAPRWLYGRTWGVETKSLRIEQRLGDNTRLELARFGHQAEFVENFSDVVGHAAAIQRDPASGVLSGAADPRGEGIAAGW